MAGAAFLEAINLLDVVPEIAEAMEGFETGMFAVDTSNVTATQVAQGTIGVGGAIGIPAGIASLNNSNSSNHDQMIIHPGTTRTGRHFRSPQIIRENPGDDTGEAVHRRISTGIQTNMSSTGNSAEVPVVPPPKKISKIAQDYTTIVLPYFVKFELAESNVNENSMDIRLNSIYDPLVTDKSNRQPQGRDAFASVYQYYRVISSHVQVQWHNSGVRASVIDVANSTQTGSPLDATWVVGWETQNGELEAITDTVDAFMMTKHAHRQMLFPAQGNIQHYYNATTAAVESKIVSQNVSTATVEYNYTPESFIQETGHVQNVNKSEFWTPVGESPEHRHILSLRTFGLDEQEVNDNQMHMLIYISYVVQFREYSNAAIKRLDSGGATYPTGEGNADTITGA